MRSILRLGILPVVLSSIILVILPACYQFQTLVRLSSSSTSITSISPISSSTTTTTESSSSSGSSGGSGDGGGGIGRTTATTRFPSELASDADDADAMVTTPVTIITTGSTKATNSNAITITTTTTTKDNNNNNDDDDENRRTKGFGGCLIVMDDNHYLIEWLAYHYTILPLERLIVGVDPKSKTSPHEIFMRYHARNFINITIWENDTMYMSPQLLHKFRSNPRRLFYKRQDSLYKNCLKQLKHEGYTYVAIIDTDEYIHINNEYEYGSGSNSQRGRRPKQQQYQNYQTVMDVLNEQYKNNNNNNNGDESLSSSSSPACIGMHRSQTSIHTTTTTDDTTLQYYYLPSSSLSSSSDKKNIPATFNFTNIVSNLNTMNYVYHYLWPKNGTEFVKGKSIAGKSIIDVSQIRLEEFYDGNHNCHLPIMTACKNSSRNVGSIFSTRKQSQFVVHHYSGTLEQFTYRNHNNNESNNTTETNNPTTMTTSTGDVTRASYRYYERDFRNTSYRDLSITTWFQHFIHKLDYNMTLINILLQNVGQVVKE